MWKTYRNKLFIDSIGDKVILQWIWPDYFFLVFKNLVFFFAKNDQKKRLTFSFLFGISLTWARCTISTHLWYTSFPIVLNYNFQQVLIRQHTLHRSNAEPTRNLVSYDSMAGFVGITYFKNYIKSLGAWWWRCVMILMAYHHQKKNKFIIR